VLPRQAHGGEFTKCIVRPSIFVFVCVCVCARALICIGRFWNRNPAENKTYVPDQRKQTRVMRKTIIFNKLLLAGRGVNHPRLLNGEIKERVVL